MTIPNLTAQLRAAAEDRADPFAWFEAASRSNITRILDAYAEMERERDEARALAARLSRTMGQKMGVIDAALQQKDKTNE